MKYQIVDWDKNFENDRSRSRKSCSFVCVPNKQHGMGFSRIMAEKDGSSIYGIWQCIVGACSQQAVRNGWLTFDGEQTGSAWGADDLALKFRRPASEITRALSFLSSDKVGWIKAHETNDLEPTHRAVTAQSPSGILKEEKEGNRREGIEEKVYSPDSRIALHWLNEKSGKRFRETETSLAPINARLSEPDVDIEGVKMMIERQCKLWAGTKMQEYLTPTTLFGKEKFSNYYANREQPIILTDKPEKEKHHFII